MSNFFCIMSYDVLVHGFIIGFSIAMPIGPMALMCIEKTLSRSWLVGLLSGVSIALADATYGLVATLGLTTISRFLLSYEFPLKLFGGIFIIYLGYTFFKDKTEKEAKELESKSEIFDLVKIYLLTLSSPTTILAFATIFLGVGISTEKPDFWSGAIVVLGVFLGSVVWWLILTTITASFKSKLLPKHITLTTRLGGIFLILFGIKVLMVLIIS